MTFSMNLLPVFAVGVIMMFTIMHLPKSRVFYLHPSSQTGFVERDQKHLASEDDNYGIV